jgi:preprotein translocase subunit SecB
MKSIPQATVTVPDLLASIQLDRYLVDDLVFKCNKTGGTKKDTLATPTIGIDFDVKENTKDKSRFLLDMVVDLNEGQELDKFETYQIHLHILGWFQFTAELDANVKAKMLATNASAMLYGVARTVVANLTGSLGPERYILPALNLLAVIKAKMASRPEITKAPAAVIGKR